MPQKPMRTISGIVCNPRALDLMNRSASVSVVLRDCTPWPGLFASRCTFTLSSCRLALGSLDVLSFSSPSSRLATHRSESSTAAHFSIKPLATAKTNHSSGPCLLALPAAIRNHIYDLVFPKPIDEEEAVDPVEAQPPERALLLCCWRGAIQLCGGMPVVLDGQPILRLRRRV